MCPVIKDPRSDGNLLKKSPVENAVAVVLRMLQAKRHSKAILRRACFEKWPRPFGTAVAKAFREPWRGPAGKALRAQHFAEFLEDTGEG